MEIFCTYNGRVSLTSDTWASTFGEPFVCVSAHWIDDAMEKAHNGFNIKTRIVSCCKNIHVVDKLFSISLDNATANTKAMNCLCCAHIMNLCVQEGLHELRTLLEPIRGVTRWIRAARSAKRIFKHKCDEYGLRKKLLHDAIAYRDVLTDMYHESRTTDGRFITNDHWSLAKIVHNVLETFDNATQIFSYVYEPNIHMQTSQANLDPSIKNLLDNMKVKWCAYFTEFPPIYAIAAILDLGVKLKGLTNLLPFYYDQLGVSFDVPYYVNKCKIILERLCEDYGAVIQPQPVGSSTDTLDFGFLDPF
ncbi:putative AC transposase [Bienertia sinuspersici]